uniref:Uncharacterized protein n=1 Tax=Meloidogyne floridensis TaxID=298350 RepID=A0A915NHC0_9BILA
MPEYKISNTECNNYGNDINLKQYQIFQHLYIIYHEVSYLVGIQSYCSRFVSNYSCLYQNELATIKGKTFLKFSQTLSENDDRLLYNMVWLYNHA